jgi:hypothetical protein
MNFIIKYLKIFIVHSTYSYFGPTLYKWCGQMTINFSFHMELVAFRLTEGRLELLKISVYFFWVLVCVTHTSLHHSWKVGVTMH